MTTLTWAPCRWLAGDEATAHELLYIVRSYPGTSQAGAYIATYAVDLTQPFTSLGRFPHTPEGNAAAKAACEVHAAARGSL